MLKPDSLLRPCIYFLVVFVTNKILFSVTQFWRNNLGSQDSQENHAIIDSPRYLGCKTEKRSISSLTWEYTNLDGIKLIRDQYVDSNGTSVLTIHSGEQGYYSCNVSQNGGIEKVFSVGIVNINKYSGNLLICVINIY